MLFTTEGAEEFISGVILFDETIRQKASNGVAIPELSPARESCPASRSTKERKISRSPPAKR
jgi:fructose-bisphosphate aldolase class I